MGSDSVLSIILSALFVMGGFALFCYILYLVVKALRKYTSR